MIIIDLVKLILSKSSTKNAFVLSDRLVTATTTTTICVRYLKEPRYPPLIDHEIVEIFARGSGPGGQKLNKTANRVQIKHIPTGNLHSNLSNILEYLRHIFSF